MVPFCQFDTLDITSSPRSVDLAAIAEAILILKAKPAANLEYKCTKITHEKWHRIASSLQLSWWETTWSEALRVSSRASGHGALVPSDLMKNTTFWACDWLHKSLQRPNGTPKLLLHVWQVWILYRTLACSVLQQHVVTDWCWTVEISVMSQPVLTHI